MDLSDDNMSESDIFDPNLVVDRLPSSTSELVHLQNKVKSRIEFYKNQFLEEEEANRSTIKSYL